VHDSWRRYYWAPVPDAGGCVPPVAPPVAGATTVGIVVEFELEDRVAGRAFGGRFVTAVFVGVVDPVGADVGGMVVFVS
jgi:hypothetical protein